MDSFTDLQKEHSLAEHLGPVKNLALKTIGTCTLEFQFSKEV